MNTLILNRESFSLPTDGWYQVAPLGEFAHEGAGIVQVIDRDACTAMAAQFSADAKAENFAGLLVDFDHFSLDGEKRSEAAGWIGALEARGQESGDRSQESVGGEDGAEKAGNSTTKVTKNTKGGEGGAGLWAQIRWSDVGEAAVKGGRYRFLSPVWARSDCVDLGSGRFRPVRLINAAVTNDPNLKGMVPLSNRGQEAGGRGPVSEEKREKCTPVENQKGGPLYFPPLVEGGVGQAEGGRLKAEGGRKESSGMKAVIERLVNHLGLAGDATEDVILEKMAGLPTLTAVADVQNSLRDLQGKHDAVVTNLKKVEGDLVNRHLAEFEGVISEGTKTFWSEQLLQNRDGALLALRDAQAKVEGGRGKVEGTEAGTESTPSASSGQARKPLHNRATARPVPPGTGGVPDGTDSRAVKIRNRAHEIAKAEGVAFSTAFRRAEKEVVGQ